MEDGSRLKHKRFVLYTGSAVAAPKELIRKSDKRRFKPPVSVIASLVICSVLALLALEIDGYLAALGPFQIRSRRKEVAASKIVFQLLS
jgi:hypothetical protein